MTSRYQDHYTGDGYEDIMDKLDASTQHGCMLQDFMPEAVVSTVGECGLHNRAFIVGEIFDGACLMAVPLRLPYRDRSAWLLCEG